MERKKVGKEIFLEEKVKFKELVEKKQNEKRKEEEEELKKIKSKVEIWRYIKKKRGNKTKKENKIRKKEWRKHFRWCRNRSKDGGMGDGRSKKDIGDMIEEEEIRTALKRMKLKKGHRWKPRDMQEENYGQDWWTY